MADVEPYMGRRRAAAESQAESQFPADGFSDTDMANATRLAERFGDELRFTPERGWLVWDGRRWAADEKDVQVQARAKATALSIYDEINDSANRAEVFAHAKRSQQKRAIDAMIWLARSEPGVPAKLTQFDANPWLLNVGNGTLDLRSGNLRPHRRDDLITAITDVQYDAAAECEQWDAFLWRVTDRNEDLYKYVRRFVGYLLVDCNR